MILILIILALGFGIVIELVFPTANSFMDAFDLVMGLLLSVLDILLIPINYIIDKLIPGLNDALLQIADYFDLANTYMAWIFSAFAIPATAVTLAASYYLFTFLVTVGVYSFKLIIKWKNAIL